MLNPACFVFPAANGCRPGDRFTVADREQAEAFLAYRAIPFRRPVVQHVADLANLLALLGSVVLLLAYGVRRRRRA